MNHSLVSGGFSQSSMIHAVAWLDQWSYCCVCWRSIEIGVEFVGIFLKY